MKDKKKINFAAIITVRTSSSRLPKKCHQKLFKDLSLIEIVIDRAKKINAKIIVATSTDKSDDNIERIALKKKVNVFRGSLLNKIHRWNACFKKYKLDYAMLIDADDPSFCFNLMNKALDKLSKSKADIICGSRNLLPGLLTYGMSKKGIKKLSLTAKNNQTDTDVIDTFLQKAKLKTSKIYPKKKNEIKDNIRLTVDYLEDLIFYRKLYKKISYLENSLKIVSIIKKFKLKKINWFRNKDFKINQQNFNKRQT